MKSTSVATKGLICLLLALMAVIELIQLYCRAVAIQNGKYTRGLVKKQRSGPINVLAFTNNVNKML